MRSPEDPGTERVEDTWYTKYNALTLRYFILYSHDQVMLNSVQTIIQNMLTVDMEQQHKQYMLLQSKSLNICLWFPKSIFKCLPPTFYSKDIKLINALDNRVHQMQL